MDSTNTFEQQFKTKIGNDLDNFVTDRELLFVNDFALITDCDGTQVYGTIVTGEGQRVVSTGDDNIQQTFNVFFYVPINFAQNLMKYLVDYGSSESALGNVQTLTDYTFYVNWNTPTTDGIPFKLGAYNYLLVTLTGNLIYSTGVISLGNTEIRLNNQILKNIVTYTFNAQPQTELINVAGIPTSSLLVTGINETLSVTVLFDRDDPLHFTLLQYAKNPDINQSEVQVGLPSSSFKGVMSVTTQEAPNSFTYLKIDLLRNDLFGEV